MKFGTQGSNQREGLSSKITLVKFYGMWTILVEFIEPRMKVTVNKCEHKDMYIYTANVETSNATSSFQNQPKKHQSSNKYNMRPR